MSKVIIHLQGGKSYETTDLNVENTRRLLGSQVVGVEFADKENQQQDLTEAIDDELIVEVIEEEEEEEVIEETTKLTLEELKNSDKDVLRKLADEIAASKEITKCNGRSGVEKLAQYIFDNQ